MLPPTAPDKAPCSFLSSKRCKLCPHKYHADEQGQPGSLTWINCSYFQSKKKCQKMKVFYTNSIWHFIELLITNFWHELFATFYCAVCYDMLWSAVSKPASFKVNFVATNIAGGTRASPVTIQNASETPILQFLRKGKKDEFNFNSTTHWSFNFMTSFLQTAGTCVPGADVSMIRLKVTKLTLRAKGCKG